MLDQWAEYQDEFAEAYYPLKGIKWVDDSAAFAGDDAARRAYLEFAETWDSKTGLLKYLDMSQNEKEWEAIAMAMPFFGGSIGGWSISRIKLSTKR